MTNVDLIHSQITMIDVLDKYGLGRPNKNKIFCPFHNEKTPSFFVKGIFYNCFVCGGGDTIRFVEKFFNISFNQAIAKLDYDFNLNLPLGRKLSLLERRKQNKQISERNKKNAQREQNYKRVWDEYWKSFDEWVRLDNNKRTYSPKSPDEKPHPLFSEALNRLTYQEYLVDIKERTLLNEQIRI